MLLAVDRKERIARISLIGPAGRMPELLPLPAHGEGSFDEGGLRVGVGRGPGGVRRSISAIGSCGAHGVIGATATLSRAGSWPRP